MSYLEPIVSVQENTSVNGSPGNEVWTLPKSMEQSVVPIAFVTYEANALVNFTSSVPTGYFVGAGVSQFADQCLTDYSRSCIVAYHLPSSPTNLTIEASLGNSNVTTRIDLQ